MTFPFIDPRRARGQTPVTISGLVDQAEAAQAARHLEDIFSPAELARLEHVRRVHRLGEFWRLDYPEIKRGLFMQALIAAGRIGRGDRE